MNKTPEEEYVKEYFHYWLECVKGYSYKNRLHIHRDKHKFIINGTSLYVIPNIEWLTLYNNGILHKISIDNKIFIAEAFSVQQIDIKENAYIIRSNTEAHSRHNNSYKNYVVAVNDNIYGMGADLGRAKIDLVIKILM